MKEFSIQLLTLSDLMKFHKYVCTNHLYGKIKQNAFQANIRSLCGVALAMPLDHATIILEKYPETFASFNNVSLILNRE